MWQVFVGNKKENLLFVSINLVRRQLREKLQKDEPALYVNEVEPCKQSAILDYYTLFVTNTLSAQVVIYWVKKYNKRGTIGFRMFLTNIQ